MTSAETPRKSSLQTDVWFLETLWDAADWIVARGGPAELSTFIRIAACELQSYYRNDPTHPESESLNLDHLGDC